MCRLWSTELSLVKPQLDAQNVRLCGVGLEELGVEEFQEGKFFTGGLEKTLNLYLCHLIHNLTKGNYWVDRNIWVHFSDKRVVVLQFSGR